MINLQHILAPISADAPSGPDLSYDADFLGLEQAAQGKPEQQFGDNVIPGTEPDWQDVKNRSEALLGRSKDLRVVVLLARALTRLHHVEGLSVGLELIRELLARYWNTLHPELDREDANDPVMRLNALGPLADSGTFLRDIRNANLVSSPQHGRVSIRDVLVATGKLAATSDKNISETQLLGILRAVSSENPKVLEAALTSAGSVIALEALLSDKGVLAHAPDLREVDDVLRAVSAVCRVAMGEQEDGEGAGAPGERQGKEARVLPSTILSRDDAIRVLGDVCRFIEHSEPSNPAPLLIRRAQRLMSRSFVEIIQDLAPESLEQIQRLAGLDQK